MSKHLITSMALAMMLGSATYQLDNGQRVSKPLEPRPRGKEPVGKTAVQRLQHNLHEKKIKARRNAKKGIYEHKISYKHLKKAGEK